jgi:hypothetical protein
MANNISFHRVCVSVCFCVVVVVVVVAPRNVELRCVIIYIYTVFVK